MRRVAVALTALIALTVLVGVILGGCIYLPAVSPAPPTTPELAVYRAINQERAKVGLSPLTLDTDVDRGLSKIARIRVQQMADQGYFAHTDPDGFRAYTELLRIFSWSYSWAGELLAMNNYAIGESPARAVASWMGSESHRNLIVSAKYDRVGVGQLTTDDGRHLYAVILVGDP